MECATQVEQEIAFYGPENVGTMLGETMIGTGGVIPPPPEYWPMVNEICKANDVLVINDEVITGFGRSGTWFGFEQFGSDPDLITLAKGLSSGYLPLGAVGAKDHVFDAFLGGPGEAFMSGATYMGHPLCCAAGIANLEIVEREQLVERCAELGPYLQDGLATLLAHPIVGDVRGVGLVAGIEYVQGQGDARVVRAGAGRRREDPRRGLQARRLRAPARRRPRARGRAAVHHQPRADRHRRARAGRVDRRRREGPRILTAAAAARDFKEPGT